MQLVGHSHTPPLLGVEAYLGIYPHCFRTIIMTVNSCVICLLFYQTAELISQFYSLNYSQACLGVNSEDFEYFSISERFPFGMLIQLQLKFITQRIPMIPEINVMHNRYCSYCIEHIFFFFVCFMLPFKHSTEVFCTFLSTLCLITFQLICEFSFSIKLQ